MATPSVSAARVLMISSNLVGRSIGRLAGAPPASTLRQRLGDVQRRAQHRRAGGHEQMRLAAATASSNPDDYRLELGVIDHWCFHGVLDELWLVDQLLGMLSIGLVPNNGYRIVEWLGKLTERHVDRAVEILLGLVQHADKNRWIYIIN
jgi:hypothetical protein